MLTEELESRLQGAHTLSELEDLCRPYRPKRHTPGSVAKERGLEPMALWLMIQDPQGEPGRKRKRYQPGKGLPDAESALAGARDILAETVSDDADMRKDCVK